MNYRWWNAAALILVARGLVWATGNDRFQCSMEGWSPAKPSYWDPDACPELVSALHRAVETGWVVDPCWYPRRLEMTDPGVRILAQEMMDTGRWAAVEPMVRR